MVFIVPPLFCALRRLFVSVCCERAKARFRDLSIQFYAVIGRPNAPRGKEPPAASVHLRKPEYWLFQPTLGEKYPFLESNRTGPAPCGQTAQPSCRQPFGLLESLFSVHANGPKSLQDDSTRALRFPRFGLLLSAPVSHVSHSRHDAARHTRRPPAG